jgi:hypothetical protein
MAGKRNDFIADAAYPLVGLTSVRWHQGIVWVCRLDLLAPILLRPQELS